MNYQLKQLPDCPECLTTVGRWVFDQWWCKRYNDPEVVYNFLRTHAHKDIVPFTLVAFANRKPVGSCYVIESDCVHRREYTPWVAAVYVKPEMRRRSVASCLLQEAAAIAAKTNIPCLYIDCLASTAPVYEKNGWSILEREVGDKDSVIMRRVTGK